MAEKITDAHERNDAPPPREFPASWFKAIKDGNAFFPFSSTGVSTFFLDALFAEHSSFEEIEKVTEAKYATSDKQRQDFMISMHEFHATYATPIAGEGRAEELDDDIYERTGKSSPVVPVELSKKGFERFMDGLVLSPKIVLDYFREQVGHLVGSEQELYTVVKAYIGHAAHVIKHDKEVRKAMKAYMEEHRAFSLSPHIVDHERDLDAGINNARGEVTRAVMSGIHSALSEDPVFANRTLAEREQLIETLGLAYGKVHRRPLTPGILL